MLHRKHAARFALAATILSVSIAAAQPKRDPDLPYVPTTDDAVKAMLKLGDVKKTDVVYDLGCGDGRIVIAAAKNYGARAVGFDINPEGIVEAKANSEKAAVTNLVPFEEIDL